MKKTIKISLLAAMLLVSDASADWSDDYVHTQTAGQTYDMPGGGKFRNFGGYSLKTKPIDDSGQAFSYRKPKMKGGCGGIDIDFGGFGFNGDVFIQKAKKIVAAAPGFAFQYAMKTFAPQVAEIIDMMDAVATALNNMDLDSCAVSEALVNKGGDLMFGVQAKQDSAVPSSGNGSSYAAAQKDTQEQVTNSKWSQITPTSIRNFDFNAAILGAIGEIGDGWKGDKTFLDYVASKNTTSFANLAHIAGLGSDAAKGVLLTQALVGDIGVGKDAGGVVIPSFAAPITGIYDLFINGNKVNVVKPKFGDMAEQQENSLVVTGISSDTTYRDSVSLDAMKQCLDDIDTFVKAGATATISASTLSSYSKWFNGTNIYRFKKVGLLTDIDNKSLAEAIYVERKKVAMQTVILAISKNLSKNSEGDLSHNVTKEKALLVERIKIALKDIANHTDQKTKDILEVLKKSKDDYQKKVSEKFMQKMNHFGSVTKIK